MFEALKEFLKKSSSKSQVKKNINSEIEGDYINYRLKKSPNEMDKNSRLWPFAVQVAEGFLNENLFEISKIADNANKTFSLDVNFLKINKNAWLAFAEAMIKYGLADEYEMKTNEIVFSK